MTKQDTTKTTSDELPIALIFIISTFGIMLTVGVIHFVAGVEYRDDKDIFNWVSLVIEIGIASGITIAVWRYSKFEQQKTNKLILNINQITTKLDNIIQEQDRIQTLRKKFLHESLYGNVISILNSTYNISNDQPIRELFTLEGIKFGELNEYVYLKQMSETLSERMRQFNDIMEPETYASLSTVCNLINGKYIGKADAGSIIQQSKRVLKSLDTTLFSIENITGTEILEKI